ncbi:division/cell wall cluster transcriptional repressor MraZ [Myxococcota bacterium]
MFRGNHVHSIDVKGRVSLPARFRELLLADGDGRFVLTPALFDPCLHLHPMRPWVELEKKIAGLPRFDRHVELFRRRYISPAVDCELDRAGRVLVPPSLRDRAALQGDVLWAGMGEAIELWSKAAWEAASEISPADEEGLRRTMEKHGL